MEHDPLKCVGKWVKVRNRGWGYVVAWIENAYVLSGLHLLKTSLVYQQEIEEIADHPPR